jgi:hypothetical protein
MDINYIEGTLQKHDKFVAFVFLRQNAWQACLDKLEKVCL